MMPLSSDVPDTQSRIAGMVLPGAVGVLGFVRLRMLGAMAVMLVCVISAAAEPPEKPVPKALPVEDDEPQAKPLTKMMEEADKELAQKDKNWPRQGAGKEAPALTRYNKLVMGQVERKWHLYLNLRRGREGVTTGEMEIVFYVNQKGKVEGLKVINDKKSSPALTETTLRAIKDAEIPPIPADVIPLLPKEDLGRLKINFHAVVY